MLKARYLRRLIIAFFARFQLTLFLGVIIGLAIFVFFNFFSSRINITPTEVTAIVGRYRIEELPHSILSLVGEGLTTISPSGEISPGLAESWEVSEDKTTWTFHLKDGKKWHDNSLVTSAHLNYNFKDVEISRPDDKTIVFKLNNVFSPFVATLSRPIFKKGLLGTGEWRVRNISLSAGYIEKIELINKDSHKKTIQFFPNEEKAKTAFKLGQADILANTTSADPFNDWKTAQVAENVNYEQYVGIFFNTATDPFKDNKPLRQALFYAIDKQTLNPNRALSPINPLSWAYNTQVKSYEYDPDHAKNLLGNGPIPEIKLTCLPRLLPQAEKIAEYWNTIGIKTTVQVVNIIPSDYQAFLGIYEIPRDPDQYPMWHSSQSETTNITHYQSPRIDKLLEDGRTEMNNEERKRIYLDFQRFLLEDAPAVFLYHPTLYTIQRK